MRQLHADCYYFRPPTAADLDKLDMPAAFRYFSRSFQNPAEFTICFTGSLKVCYVATYQGTACNACGPCISACATDLACTCRPHSASILPPFRTLQDSPSASVAASRCGILTRKSMWSQFGV